MSIFEGEIIRREEASKDLIKPERNTPGHLMKRNAEDEKFSQLYIKNRFSGTKAIKEMYGYEDNKVCSNKASIYLKREQVRRRIVELLLGDDYKEVQTIVKALKAETPVTISWRDKHKFVETALELKGLLNKDKTPNTDIKIGLVINE